MLSAPAYQHTFLTFSLSLSQFIDSLIRIHSEKRAKKRGKGDKWIDNLLKTLGQGCLVFELQDEQEAEELEEAPGTLSQEATQVVEVAQDQVYFLFLIILIDPECTSLSFLLFSCIN